MTPPVLRAAPSSEVATPSHGSALEEGFLSFHLGVTGPGPEGTVGPAASDGGRVLDEVCRLAGVEGAVVLGTCHRREIYVHTTDPAMASHAIKGFLRRSAAAHGPDAARDARTLRGAEALRHLFAVAAGLESVLVGEEEIQGQVRAAFGFADAAGHATPLLRRVFGRALETGRAARRLPGHAGLRASLGHLVAAAIAAHTQGRGTDLLLIGAGAAARSIAHALVSGPYRITVVNRTAERARALAEDVDAQWAPWETLQQLVPQSRVVVLATSGRDWVLRAEHVEAQPARPLVVDVTKPVLAHPDARARLGPAYLGLDDLMHRFAVAAPQQFMDEARSLVEQEAARFAREDALRHTTPGRVLAMLHREAEQITVAELEKLHQRLPHLSADDRAVLSDFARSLRAKLYHGPTQALRSAMEAGRGDLAVAAQELFGTAPPSSAPTDDGGTLS